MTSCAELFGEYTAESEAIKQKAYNQVPQAINALIEKNQELMQQYDTACLLGDTKQAEEIMAASDSNEKRIKWLEHEQELLRSTAGTKNNPKLVAIAQQWQAQSRIEIEVLRKEWRAAENALESAQTALLACVAKLGSIARRANKLRGHANAMGMTGHAPAFIVLPNDQTDPNPQHLRGKPWAVTPEIITKTYKDGRLEA